MPLSTIEACVPVTSISIQFSTAKGIRCTLTCAERGAGFTSTGRINSSTADYLWVGGHYPVWSIATHGPSSELVKKLRPLLHKYDGHYFNGHDHDLEHIRENGSAVNYVTTGSGMACCYPDNNLNKVPAGSVRFAMVGQVNDLIQISFKFTLRTLKEQSK